MKRSRSVSLVAMGTGLMLVATGCDEAKVDTALFESIKQCETLGFSRSECEANHRRAAEMHTSVAPKYASKAECEADFGGDKCEIAPQKTTAGGSVFMPLMMGYMMGSMLGSQARAQPLYRGRGEANFRTADNRNVGSTVGRTQVAKGIATRTPSVKTSTVSRGGFGANARRSAAG